MAILLILLGAAIVVAISVLHAQNPLAVDLSFFGYGATGVPLWLLVSVPAGLGLLLGYLMALPARVRGALGQRRLGSRVSEQEKEINALNRRVIELERDLADARRRAEPVTVEETREDIPSGTTTTTRTHMEAA